MDSPAARPSASRSLPRSSQPSAFCATYQATPPIASMISRNTPMMTLRMILVLRCIGNSWVDAGSGVG
jgi:hypothetical protein